MGSPFSDLAAKVRGWTLKNRKIRTKLEKYGAGWHQGKHHKRQVQSSKTRQSGNRHVGMPAGRTLTS